MSQEAVATIAVLTGETSAEAVGWRSATQPDGCTSLKPATERAQATRGVAEAGLAATARTLAL